VIPKPPAAADNLPGFSSSGHLPPGDYWPSRTDFHQRFVDVGASKTRRPIANGWASHRSDLVACGCAPDSACLLDGSYTSSKADPGDIDLVVIFAPPRDSKSFTATLALLRGPNMKAKYCCDAYPLIALPVTHPKYATVTEKGLAYWRKWFGHDRSGAPKGRVWSRLDGLL